MPCRPLFYGDGLISGISDFVDCQAQNLGWQGYAALSTPGSLVSLLLAILLTLFIGFQGYRMVLGHTPSMREVVLAAVKIGVVLMLATSWPAYRVLIYDTAVRGPAELASSITDPAGLPSASDGLAARLQLLDDNLEVLARSGTFGFQATVPPPQQPQQPGAPPQQVQPQQRQQPYPLRREGASVFEPSAFDSARLVFLCSVIGALALPRLLVGVLLGLGPFFIAFLLFDTSKRLTEGWMRALAGAALAGMGTSVVLSVELALLEPWIADLLARRAAQLTRLGSPVEMLAMASVFAFMLTATLFGSARIAGSLRLPDSQRMLHLLEAAVQAGSRERETSDRTRETHSEERSRAAAIAEAVGNGDRRREAIAAGGVLQRVQVTGQAQAREAEPAAVAPLGQAGVRRTRQRLTGIGQRRDRTA